MWVPRVHRGTTRQGNAKLSKDGDRGRRETVSRKTLRRSKCELDMLVSDLHGLLLGEVLTGRCTSPALNHLLVVPKGRGISC